MNVVSILLWGFAATIVLTTLTIAAQSFGLTRIDIPFIVGTMFTSNRDRARAIGVAIHMINGWLFAMLYAIYFENIHLPTLWFGALMGTFQGIFVAIVLLPALPGIHPRMVSDFRGPEPTRLLEPPGFLAVNYGRLTPIVIIAVHAIYGAIIGAFYQPR
jgi:hypothetical protein